MPFENAPFENIDKDSAMEAMERSMEELEIDSDSMKIVGEIQDTLKRVSNN